MIPTLASDADASDMDLTQIGVAKPLANTGKDRDLGHAIGPA
jgi:hypothetical protein